MPNKCTPGCSSQRSGYRPSASPSEVLVKLLPTELGISGYQEMVYGVRVQDIDDPLIQKIRHLDKLIDKLAREKVMEKILR
jgi:hypothetical protein